jgi:anti-sigma B factor antagonist
MAVKSFTLPNGVGVLELIGPILTEQDIIELRGAIAEFVTRRWRKLVIDFSKTTYLNSTSVGVLIAAHTSYARREWQLKVCAMNKHVHAIFAITNLMKIFSVYDTREEAVNSFL